MEQDDEAPPPAEPPAAPPAEPEEEDITSYRPGDTVMTIRKRIREARKVQLLKEQREMQEMRAKSPLHSRMPLVPEAKVTEAEAHELAQEDQGAGMSNGRRPLQKVEGFHKDLIRKEVWRQKFNYLFRKMLAGVDNELINDRKNRRLSLQQQRGREEEDAEARRQRVAAGLQETVERDLTKLRRASGAGSLDMARIAQIAMAQEVETEDADAGETETEEGSGPVAILDEVVEVMDTPKPPKPLRWRRTGPLRPKAAVALPPPVNREVKKPGVSEGREGGRRKRGIAGLLQQSTSLPVLRTTPDLVGVRDEYYEGDELFMHEDVLYSSNPRLFPLREGRKPFPTVKLTLPNFDLFNLE